MLPSSYGLLIAVNTHGRNVAVFTVRTDPDVTGEHCCEVFTFKKGEAASWFNLNYIGNNQFSSTSIANFRYLISTQ